MKRKGKIIMNKFSAIVFIATILITVNVYGQETATQDTLLASSSLVAVDVKSDVKSAKVKSDTAGKAYRDFCRHEFLMWVGGGLSSLNYNPNVGDRNYNLGGAVGLGYGFHFSPHWSLGIGAEVAMYNMKMNVDDLTDSYSIDDQDDDPIRYYTQINEYTEKQRLYTVNVPLWLQYKTPIAGTRNEFYAALGFKLGIPFSAKYTIDNARLDAFGYYEDYNVTLYDQRDLGYGDNAGKILQEDLEFDLVYTGMVETGVKWHANRVMNIYTGIYFDYGFNDIAKKRGSKFLEYNYQNPENFKNNSVLTSEYTQQGKTNNFMNHISTIAVGLKVRFGFNLCNNKPEKKEPEVEEMKMTSKAVGPRDVKKSLDDDEVQEDDINRLSDLLADRLADRVADVLTDRVAEILLKEERKRAMADYGHLTDVMVVYYIDGYEVNQYKLSPIMEKMLDEKVELLQKYNNDKYIIICEGHTCNLGTANANLKLAQTRAEEIKNYLVNQGFKSENLVVTSKGKNAPILPNINDINRKLNRRVVFLVKEKR